MSSEIPPIAGVDEFLIVCRRCGTVVDEGSSGALTEAPSFGHGCPRKPTPSRMDLVHALLDPDVTVPPWMPRLVLSNEELGFLFGLFLRPTLADDLACVPNLAVKLRVLMKHARGEK